MRELSTAELAAWIADHARTAPAIVDVREAWELERANFGDALADTNASVVHIPMRTIPASLEQLDAGTPTVVLCHHGARSLQVAIFLERNGFSDVYNLTGGINAWAATQDPSIGRY